MNVIKSPTTNPTPWEVGDVIKLTTYDKRVLHLLVTDVDGRYMLVSLEDGKPMKYKGAEFRSIRLSGLKEIVQNYASATGNPSTHLSKEDWSIIFDYTATEEEEQSQDAEEPTPQENRGEEEYWAHLKELNKETKRI